jgi:hypothetical protein
MRVFFYFLLTYIVLACSQLKQESDFPKPTDESIVMRDQSDDARLKRHELKDKFFADMHRAAPNFDWETADINYRLQQSLHAKSALKSARTNDDDSLANGFLIGKWNERGSSNQSGRILMADYVEDEDLLYSTSQGGNLWKGNLNGTNWQVLNDKVNVGGSQFLKVVKKDSLRRILIGTNNKYFYYTDDEGGNYHISNGLDNVQGWGSIRKSIILNNTNRRIYTLNHEWDYSNWGAIMRLYYSDDLGENFHKMDSFRINTHGPTNRYDIWTPTYGKHGAYLIVADSILYLDSVQTTITGLGKISNSPGGYSLLTGFAKQNECILYAYINRQIFKSSNNGVDWAYVDSTKNTPFRNTSFACSIQDSNKLYLGGVNCYYSNNGGKNWNLVNEWWKYYGSEEDQLHADVPSISEFWKNGATVTIINTDGGLYKSLNKMNTVQNLSLHGHNVSQYYSVYTNKNSTNFIYAGSQDQGFQRTSSDNQGILDFEQIISGDYGHIVSTDGGESFWTNYPGFTDFYADGRYGLKESRWNFTSMQGHYWIPPMQADPVNNNVAYLAGGYISPPAGSYIIKLSSMGTSITPTQLPFNFRTQNDEQISAIKISPKNPQKWFVLTNKGNFFYSHDNGQNFTKSSGLNNGPEAHYFYGASIYASYNDEDLLYIAGSGYSNPPAFKSSDGGISFTAANDSLPHTLVFQITGTKDDSLLFAATEVGAFVYVAHENRWYDMQGSAGPNQRYWTVEYLDNLKTVRFGTHGRGIWDFERKKDEAIVSLNEKNYTTSISLFPNPASNSIQINTASTENLQMEVYSLSGKLVYSNSLVSSNFTLNTSSYKRGTYIVLFKSKNEIIETKKFVLVE